MKSNEDILATWSEAAPYWEKNRDTIREMFAPITAALVDDARIDRGHSALDVATGPGEPALSIGGIVGAAGSVTGIDPVPEMINAARRAAQRADLPNVRFEVASADILPFPDASFDAVVSRFGVMFFPSPLDGVREMLRVLKTGRKLALAVWHYAERNPFHYLLARVVDRYVPPEPVPPDSPDAFRFASPGKLLNILNEAGITQSSERLLQFDMKVSLSVEDFWELRLQMSDKLRKKLATLSPEQFSAVRHEVIQDLQPYSTPEGISIPAEVLIVSGTKA